MSKSSLSPLLTVSDLALGSIGAAIPPSKTVDHSVRLFGTWSGSDKLLMTAQYTAKLLAPLLLKRAELQFNAGLREKAVSLTAEGLTKFAGSVSAARRVSGLWGILPILKWLSAMERAPRPVTTSGRRTLLLERIQGLSMLAFYALEGVSFFSSPAAPLLSPRFITPATSGKAQLWSVRAWGLYTAIQISILLQQHQGLVKRERVASLGGEKGADEAELKEVRKNKAATFLSLIENLAFAPLIIHWSVRPLFASELPVDILSFIAAIAGFKNGWEKARA